MDEAQKPCLKRSEEKEDEAIANRLAAALCEDNADKFLQLYDEIPPGVSLERIGNIKEMARQLAALAKNSTTGYRVKDSLYFGINHTLNTTPSLNGQLSTPEFKTPPEGPTPVDKKHFDYEEDTLKTLQATHTFSLSLYEKQLNDSGVTQLECLDSVDDDLVPQCVKVNEVEAIKTKDDDAFEYHTPPEYHEESVSSFPDESPPFGYPPSSDKLINSVITLLSKTDRSGEVCEDDSVTDIIQNDNELGKEGHERFEACEESKELRKNFRCSSTKHIPNLETEITVNVEQDCFVEKDSLDGSPHSRRSFTQEEDDSGISIVDENDILQESSMSNSGHFETKKEFRVEKKNEDSLMTCSDSSANEKTACNSKPEMKYHMKSNELEVKHVKPNDLEVKYTKSNYYESEDSSIGWQTRQKRMSKKRHDRGFERMSYYDDANSTESHNRSNHKESTPRRSAAKNKDRNLGKTDKSDSYSKVAERHAEDKYKEKNAWRGEDSDLYESPKRSGRRGGQAGKKSDNKYTKNGSNKEKYNDFEKHENEAQNTKLQPSVFTYRDALLKVDSKVSRDPIQSQGSSKGDKMFNLDSAVNYLSTVWTSVNNLHRKDPSKVYIYNGD